LSSSNERNIHKQKHDGDELNRNEQLGNEFSDLVLDVPMLNVDELDLEVNDLRAHVSLRAELADLVKINVGVDIHLDKVKLGIKGLEAQALLKVKLERVLGIIGEGLEVIDHNPQIVGQATQADRAALGASKDVSQAAWEASQNMDTAADPTEAQTVQRGVDEQNTIVERIVNEAGEMPNEWLMGNGDDLQTEEEYIDDRGRIVARARDDSGNIFEEIQDEEGNVLDLNASEEEDQGGEDEDISEVRATNAAKRKARELDVQLSEVKGTGSGGRILVKDVEKAAG
jgi:pyruvate/2-oxoglutarate dehydrogenase complex dihydrolipoamide acyltransferase (E2) component